MTSSTERVLEVTSSIPPMLRANFFLLPSRRQRSDSVKEVVKRRGSDGAGRFGRVDEDDVEANSGRRDSSSALGEEVVETY